MRSQMKGYDTYSIQAKNSIFSNLSMIKTEFFFFKCPLCGEPMPKFLVFATSYFSMKSKLQKRFGQGEPYAKTSYKCWNLKKFWRSFFSQKFWLLYDANLDVNLTDVATVAPHEVACWILMCYKLHIHKYKLKDFRSLFWMWT